LLARAIRPVYFEVVSPLENRVSRISEEERQAALARTSGCLSPEEADEMERVIEEGCERIDEDGWRPLL